MSGEGEGVVEGGAEGDGLGPLCTPMDNESMEPKGLAVEIPDPNALEPALPLLLMLMLLLLGRPEGWAGREGREGAGRAGTGAAAVGKGRPVGKIDAEEAEEAEEEGGGRGTCASGINVLVGDVTDESSDSCSCSSC